jgi:diamine N-acetyltransferase
MDTNPAFRRAHVEDAATLASFWRDRYVDTFGTLYRKQDLEAFLAESYDPARIASEISDPGFVHVLVEGQEGVHAALKGGRATLPLDDKTALWELHRLYLTPASKGTGLANALMDFATEQAKAAKASALVLGVFSENHRALRFYARHGFRQIGSYTFMVGQHRDHEFMMRKDI